jgi:hypothetical protein
MSQVTRDINLFTKVMDGLYSDERIGVRPSAYENERDCRRGIQ